MMMLNFTTFASETSFGELMTIIFFSESLSQKKNQSIELVRGIEISRMARDEMSLKVV